MRLILISFSVWNAFCDTSVMIVGPGLCNTLRLRVLAEIESTRDP